MKYEKNIKWRSLLNSDSRWFKRKECIETNFVWFKLLSCSLLCTSYIFNWNVMHLDCHWKSTFAFQPQFKIQSKSNGMVSFYFAIVYLSTFSSWFASIFFLFSRRFWQIFTLLGILNIDNSSAAYKRYKIFIAANSFWVVSVFRFVCRNFFFLFLET